MKQVLRACVIVLTFGVFSYAICAPAGERVAAWQEVREMQKKGLPKTALERLEPIITDALKDKAYAEAVRATALKVVLESEIQGHEPAERIRRMLAAITAAPAEMHPAMHTLLAHWYWQYYQQNRWRFMQRTRSAEPPGEDFTTWDLPRIFAEIDRWFVKALAAGEALKKTPIAEYDALLDKGTAPDSYRPTVFDFIAHEALAFYTSAEQAGAQAEDAFELSADSPILGAAEEFMRWRIEPPDAESPTAKAIALYQELMRFHQDDQDRAAFLDVDLGRLMFGNATAFGEEKAARYKAQLRRFADGNARHELSARALYELANVLNGDDEFAEAHRLAVEGKNRFPASVGGAMCHNLIQSIEAKSLQVDVERVWTRPFPKLALRYRNLAAVNFRVVKRDWEASIKTGGGRFGPRERDAILAAPPVLAWTADVAPTPDFRERRAEIQPPEDLAPGCYVLLASAKPDFGKEDNQVFLAEFWISDLALVVRTEDRAGVIEGFVLDATSGEPIEGAEVRAWRPKQDGRGVWESLNPKKTDRDGLFRYENVRNSSYLVHARRDGREVASCNPDGIYRNNSREQPFARTVFFTDRSLYRPGQTIRYKALCLEVDRKADKYRVLPGQQVVVAFRDANGKEIARQTNRTNDFGSASGSFTAPRDRLMGRMSLSVDGNPPGATAFNVEEYKRPRFQVTFDPPSKAPKLAEETTVAGKAIAYTGAAIDRAKVRYRVVRQVRYPPWWGWSYWYRTPQSEDREIAHGATMTEADGTFTVKFVASPDRTVAEKEEPAFRFTVSADVTDASGETRSGEAVVTVGYTALAASLTAAPWQTEDAPVEISVRTETLDGAALSAEGAIRVHRLTPPPAVVRASLFAWRDLGPFASGVPADLSNPASWPLGDVAFERGFTTDAKGDAKVSVKLAAGAYRVLLTTQDRFGKPVTAQLPLEVLAPGAEKLELKVPFRLVAPRWSVEPGEEWTALWGSGYDEARAFVEIEHRGKVLTRYWTDPARTQLTISQKVTEAMRGGFTLRVTMVRENRGYLHAEHVDVPWSTKDLTISWERFVSKLEPGQKETWTAVIAGPKATRVAAEMVAGLYDASLDAYLPHEWTRHIDVFRRDGSTLESSFENELRQMMHILGRWAQDLKRVDFRYRVLPPELCAEAPIPVSAAFDGGRGPELAASPREAAPPGAAMGMIEGGEFKVNPATAGIMLDESSQGAGDSPGTKKPDLNLVAARANLQETAFFFPHLVCDAEGKVKMEFTMPEALTEWRFLGFAHDKGLASGYLEDRAVTAKDLMVQPNPPRFIREGDVLEFTVKVSNRSDVPQAGSVRLTLADARTGASADKALGNEPTDRAFEVPARESRSFSWRLTVPDGLGFLTYKAVGATGKLSDGEEGFLPVLARRILVTESLPLPVRGPATAAFDFARLKQSGASDTLKHQSLTVQMVSNPAWYAVMALPYLMEFPHECTEQSFNRLYANALARFVAGSNPRIRRVFEQWKGTDALASPLEKNQDLKAVMLEETPWVRDAASEGEARRNVGILFDENRLDDEIARVGRKLAEAQGADGAWPWFPGGPRNDYMTLYITAGYGRLRHLGVTIDVAPAVKAIGRLDAWMTEIYRDIVKDGRKDQPNLSSTMALHLYARTLFLKDTPIDKANQEAFDYFVGQAKAHWLTAVDRQSQAHIALALARLGEEQAAGGILRSLKERSISEPLLGMYWRDTERSWWWYRAPIETQAVMIEAFSEIADDATSVSNMKVWLLTQKQTRNWKTTKATADAVYALLVGGVDLLASTALVEVALGGRAIVPEKVQAGTGYYERRFAGSEIVPEQGAITVKKVDEGLAWGSVHWQYLEDMRKVTPYAGTPLTLKKTLFTREHTAKGPALKAVTGLLGVGDELVVKIELRVDRDMEYVHLKDQRGSGTEPVNVLSGYRHQDGLGYYESTRDTASHFFIDYLPKGTYVFEYATRVVHQGVYQSGMAEIQCMYAPEFNSHSESFTLDVR